MTKTIGQLIDEMSSIREQRRELSAKDSELSAEYRELERQLIAAMEDQDMNSSTGKAARATLSTQTVGQIEDWDQLTDYIQQTGYFQLFQRRISSAAMQELMQNGEQPPGLRAMDKTTINLRNL